MDPKIELFRIVSKNDYNKNVRVEWTPISSAELNIEIQKTEKDLKGEIAEFWKSVKIKPVKWNEKEYGTEGGGFWIVAIFSGKVIWYNDIEEGFKISEFEKLGEISEYGCKQDEMIWAINKLYNLVK